MSRKVFSGAVEPRSVWSTWQDLEPNHLCAFPPRGFTLERAQGTRIQTLDGRSLVDLGGGSQGVALLGHAHPDVVAAVQRQLEHGLHVAQTVPTPQRADLLQRLHSLLPSSLEASFLTNSGTEAVECALKLAVQTTGRSGLVAAKGSFHGRSLGSLRVTHRPQYRQVAGPLVEGTSFIKLNDVEALREAVTNETAAVVLEPVQGEGGVHVAEAGFLRAARELTREHGALLVFDEVQTGLGRTGTFLACEASGVVPDIVTIGKGLAGGLPMGACSVSREVAEALPPGAHGSTYGGNPLVCAAADAVLQKIAGDRLWERAAEVGGRFGELLRGSDDPLVREVRGRGMMWGVELRVRSAPVLAALEEAGFLALSAGKNVVRFLPPLVVCEDELHAAAQALRDALALARETAAPKGAGVTGSRGKTA